MEETSGDSSEADKEVEMEMNSGDGGNSGDGNSSEGSGSWRDSQNRDGDDDDEDEEPEHSGLGACSMPSSQKGDASTEDQTSQAEELPAKNTGKTETPAPTTCQRCKQEESKEASSQVSGIPPGQGAIYRPLPEESDTVPERG